MKGYCIDSNIDFMLCINLRKIIELELLLIMAISKSIHLKLPKALILLKYKLH